MKTFNEFKQNDKITIIMLSNNDESDTAKSFMDTCKRKHVNGNVLNIENVSLYNTGDKEYIKDGDKKIQISQDSTVFLFRRGLLTNQHTIGIGKCLEKQGYFCINTLDSMNNCENKYVTAQILESHGIDVPKYALVPNENFLDSALEQVGGKFPIVMKLLSGTQGIGVSIVDSYASYRSVYQTMKKLNSHTEILIQEKIEADFDVRVQVITNCKSTPTKTLIGSMKRSKIEKDFRTNYSLGGKIDKINIDKNIQELSLKAANAVGCIWCGVDIMIDKKTKKPYILEVNSSPGVEGMSSVIGHSVFDDVLEFIKDRNNWVFAPIKVGYLEMMTIDGIGSMVSKFDTGNGSTSCSFHVDKSEEKNGMLYWELNGKKFKHKIVDYSNAEIGYQKTKRPIIELDIIFNNRLFTGVRVSPSNRSIKSTPFLVNRKFMRFIGVIVDPNSMFIVTDAPKDYNTKDAKSSSYAGIIFNEEE